MFLLFTFENPKYLFKKQKNNKFKFKLIIIACIFYVFFLSFIPIL